MKVVESNKYDLYLITWICDTDNTRKNILVNVPTDSEMNDEIAFSYLRQHEDKQDFIKNYKDFSESQNVINAYGNYIYYYGDMYDEKIKWEKIKEEDSIWEKVKL